MSDNKPPDEPAEPPAPSSPYGASPYGAPDPSAGTPGSYPQFPAAGAESPRRRRDTWKIWVGIALAIPALIATLVIAGAVGSFEGLGILAGLVILVGLGTPIVLLFFRDSRKLGVGLLIGYAVLFILVAGACVALLASYSNGG